eukprot:scaffold2220_cov143-Pinguiococcus_pyrenoidosus.AAC.1
MASAHAQERLAQQATFIENLEAALQAAKQSQKQHRREDQAQETRQRIATLQLEREKATLKQKLQEEQ